MAWRTISNTRCALSVETSWSNSGECKIARVRAGDVKYSVPKRPGLTIRNPSGRSVPSTRTVIVLAFARVDKKFDMLCERGERLKRE